MYTASVFVPQFVQTCKRVSDGEGGPSEPAQALTASSLGALA